MKIHVKKSYLLCVFIILAIGVISFGVASAAENTGQGKPKGLDIYVDDVPYGASLGGSVVSGEKAVGEFNVIVDDKDPDKADPNWFTELGRTMTPTPTPTIAPTPTATAAIPVDKGGVGAKLCVTNDKTEVIVDFAYSDCGYKNEFYLISPQYKTMGWSTGGPSAGRARTGNAFGEKWNLGKFPIGTELIFADLATDYNSGAEMGLYKTGPASRNTDNFIHAAISLKNSTGTHHKYLVSFEDMAGGGDRDYNDVEFFVSGDVSTACTNESSGDEDSGGGAIIPVYTGNICRCGKVGSKDTCIAQFTYVNSAGNMTIPVRSKSLPWNEFTGSGWTSPQKQFLCQPEVFYEDVRNAPFWTSPFWNNVDWKLGHTHSAQASCTKYKSSDKPGDANYIPFCSDLGVTCTECNP